MIRNMAGHCTLPGLGAQELTIAIDAGPIAVDERHWIAADRAIGRRAFIEQGKIRQFKIVFVHDSLSFPLFDLQLNGLFRALPARHSDKRQPSVDDGRWYCAHGMAIGQFLPIFRRNIDFTIGKTVLHTQLLPEAFRRGAGSATGRHK